MLPKKYIEDPGRIIKGGFVGEKAYTEAITSFIIVCADAIIVNYPRKSFSLACRIVKPMKGWWVIGGRMFAGERECEAIRRNFKKETDLDVEIERFKFVKINRYLWKDRQQEPQEVGCDVLAYTFAIELSNEEIIYASSHLDPKEYDASFGLQEFDIKRLISENVHQAILDLYEQIFGK